MALEDKSEIIYDVHGPVKYRFIGQPFPLKEAYEKVTGLAKFTDDVQLPDMLQAKVLGSPYPHAYIRRIDTSKAEKMPGVKAIITCKDVSRVPFYPYETRSLYPLDDHARCIGDEVAAVAAQSEEEAESALEMIEVEYEVLPSVFDPLEAAKPEAPKLHPEGNISDPGGRPFEISWGDIDRAFKESDIVVEDTMRTQMHVHTPIEARTCVAKFEGNELTAWVSTQYPHRVHQDLARVLGLPFNKVRVVSHYIGGGFGGKIQGRYYIIPALLARKADKPVKLAYSRQEEHTIARRRHSAIARAKIGANKDGTLTAMEYECYYNVGAYGNFLGGSILFGLSDFFVYRLENARFRAYDVNTNLITAQTFRSVEFPVYHFTIDQVIDQIAEKLNMDPAELRLRNQYQPGDKMKPFGSTLSSYAINECVKKAREGIEWEKKWKGWGRPILVNGPKRRGLGLAISMGWCDVMAEETGATVKLNPNGTAEVIIGTQDLGTGSNTTICQIVAEELNLPLLDDIKIITGDTKLTPFDPGAFASRTLYLGGKAAWLAAKKVKGRLFELACTRIGVKPDQLELKEKRIFVKGHSGKSLAISEVIEEPLFGSCQLQPSPLATISGLTIAGGVWSSLYKGAAIAHAVEVEVNVETGEVKIVKYVAAHDVGRAINRVIVENQICGAAIQGLGYALFEEILFDKAKKAYLNPDYMDYKIPTMLDTPPIMPFIIESNEPTGPFGAKGVGEHALNPAAAAIANAIYNSIGVRIKETPMTPERVLKALRKI